MKKWEKRILLGVGWGILLGTPHMCGSVAFAEGSFTETQTIDTLDTSSQRRHVNETAEEAYARFEESRIHAGHEIVAGSVWPLRQSFDDIDWGQVEEWSASAHELQDAFEWLRDLRFLRDPEPGRDTEPRRISWLYPDDGCFARAAMMRRKFVEWESDNSLPRSRGPQKVFVFGSLRVETNNSPSGMVRWWYHVAPIVRVGDEVLVVDPALSPAEPLTLTDWALRQSNSLGSLRFALCEPYAYDPGSSCLDPGEDSESRADAHQQTYLRREWSRQIRLGRDPERVLGEEPPWRDMEQAISRASQP